MIKLEKYYEELKNIKGEIAIINDKPVKCTPLIQNNIKRYKCIKNKMGENCVSDSDCSNERFIEWLMEEYIEKHATLNKKERLFCELVETGYIARDGNNDLYFYDHKPIKSGYQWVIPDDKGVALEVNYYTEKMNFDFIKWEDESPWKVEDILKLEVK